MSNLTNEEMARMMRPGLRVIRGTDWFTAGSPFENEDENGPGTVIGKLCPPHDYWSYLAKFFGGAPEPEYVHYKNVWKVKWDKTGETHSYVMGGSWLENGTIKYRLKIIDFGSVPKKPLGNKLSMAKNTFDLKIICQGKIIDCHKSVLCCQSDIFEAMLLNEETIEAKSGEVKIDDIEADTMEMLLYFLYHEQVEDLKNINVKLLYAADKYNVVELVEVCSDTLKRNVSLANATDLLVSAHLLNQKALFDVVAEFVTKNYGKLVKTRAWEEFKETNPKIALSILSAVLKL